MTRTVKVKLEADVSGLVVGAEKGNVALDGLEKKVTGLDRSLGKVPVVAGHAGKSLNDVGDKAAVATLQTRRFADGLDAVKRKSVEADAALKLLALQYAVTGAEADKAEMKKQQSAVNDLRRLEKLLTPAVEPGGKGGGAAVKAGSGAFGTGTASLSNPTLLGAAIALGVIGAPLIGAGIGGAVTAGAGLTGVGLGVGGAVAGNPGVFRKEWTSAIQEISQEWQRASVGFTEPTLDAIRKLRGEVTSIHMDQIFGKAAEFLPELTDATAGFVRHFGLGVEKLVNEAEPVIKAIATELPNLGAAFESAFKMIGSESEGGAKALQDLFLLVEGGIRTFGFLVAMLEHVYNDFAKLRALVPWIGPEIAKALNPEKPLAYGEAIQGTTYATSLLADKTLDLSAAYGAANSTTKQYREGLDKLFATTQSLVGATVDYEESLDTLQEALRKHKGAWDAGTASGREHIKAFEQAIQNAYNLRQANIDSGKSVADADAAFDAQLQTIIAMARAAGATQQQIDFMTQAWKNYMDLPSEKTFTTRFVTRGAPVSNTGGVPLKGAFAEGGDVREPGYYKVGERGVESVWLNRDMYVANAQQTASMMAPASYAPAAAGSGKLAVTVDFAGVRAGGIDQAMAGWFREQVRIGQITLKVNGNRVTT